MMHAGAIAFSYPYYSGNELTVNSVIASVEYGAAEQGRETGGPRGPPRDE
jgi:hypothetical protein